MSTIRYEQHKDATVRACCTHIVHPYYQRVDNWTPPLRLDFHQAFEANNVKKYRFSSVLFAFGVLGNRVFISRSLVIKRSKLLGALKRLCPLLKRSSFRSAIKKVSAHGFFMPQASTSFNLDLLHF